MILTTAQRHDSTQAQAPLDGLPFEQVMADRGYAGASFIAYPRARLGSGYPAASMRQCQTAV